MVNLPRLRQVAGLRRCRRDPRSEAHAPRSRRPEPVAGGDGDARPKRAGVRRRWHHLGSRLGPRCLRQAPETRRRQGFLLRMCPRLLGARPRRRRCARRWQALPQLRACRSRRTRPCLRHRPRVPRQSGQSPKRMRRLTGRSAGQSRWRYSRLRNMPQAAVDVSCITALPQFVCGARR